MAVSRCVPQTFTGVDIFGLETLAITANVVTNLTSGLAGVPGLNFCNVSVTTTHPGWDDNINTQVWLPTDDWNHRLQMTGGGGLSTGLVTPTMITALSDGSSVVSTDGGHYGDDPSTWALASPGNVNLYKLFDYSTASLQEGAIIGKSIIEQYYSEPPAYSYFTGCSTGGRQGLMFAQRFPDIFDGILAAAPGVNYNNIISVGFYPQLVVRESENIPRQCELNALTALAIEACDPLDGVTDGIVSAIELCEFDPFSFVGSAVPCGEGEVNITLGAASGADAAWTGLGNNGGFINPGFEYQAYLGGVLNTSCDSTGGACEQVPFAPFEQWLLYFLKKDPSYDWRNLSLPELVALQTSPDNRLYDSFLATNDPDLSEFNLAGGKMITWHGLADQYIPPSASQDYYDAVTERNPDVQDFYRYFQAPGVLHCAGGNGPVPIDALQKLVAWVEDGTGPPETLSGVSAPSAEGVVYQRPICSYPKRAVYKGQGNVTLSEHWECK